MCWLNLREKEMERLWSANEKIGSLYTRSVVKKKIYLRHVWVHLHFQPLCSLHLDAIYSLLLFLPHNTYLCVHTHTNILKSINVLITTKYSSELKSSCSLNLIFLRFISCIHHSNLCPYKFFEARSVDVMWFPPPQRIVIL